jgi:hypothetical protein
MKIVLKELRETHICLRIIKKAKLHKCAESKLEKAITESNELISIFVKSVATAQSKAIPIKHGEKS